MEWIREFEKRKSIIVGGVLFITLTALLITSLRGPLAYDPFWHLQMGKDWIVTGLSPWIDHYSFTYNGQPITNPPVIFQALLYSMVSHFGLKPGFIIVRFGSYLLTLGATLLLLRQLKAPAIIYAVILPMIVFLLQLRPLVRPELFSYTFSVIALMLYFRAGKGISTRNVLPMVGLMWVWSIYHSSVVGYVIFFGFFLDCFVDQIKSRASWLSWLEWFTWGLMIFSVGYLNPSFSHPVIEAIEFPHEWKALISEYMPFGERLLSHAGTYVLMLMAAVTPIMALKQRRFGFLVVWVALVYNAILTQRMVTPSGVVVVLLTAYLLMQDKNLNLSIRQGESFMGKTIWRVLVSLLCVTLYSNVAIANHYIKEKQTFVGRYPVAIADYMVERGISGRIFNGYGIGGYLIYKLAPNNQVYIDGRTQILYPVEHMHRYMEVAKTEDPEVLRAELDKYSIDHIIWTYSQVRHDLVEDTGEFDLDFLDARFVLYSRRDSNFSLLGKLLSQPECWRPDMLDELNAERQKMDVILPEYSALFPFADLVVGYSAAEDGKAYIDANINSETWFDEMRRFAGYRFLETGEYELAVNLIGGVEIRKPKDYLASAMAMLKAGDVVLATRILDEFSITQWPSVKPQESFIRYKLYQSLSTYRQLTTEEQKIQEDLQENLIKLGYTGLDTETEIDVQSFCASTVWQPKAFVSSDIN